MNKTSPAGIKAFSRSLLKRIAPAAFRSWYKARAKERKRQRTMAAREAAKNDPSAAKTFGYFIDHRNDWLFEKLPHASAEYHYDIHSKDKQKALARRLGLEVAHEYLLNVPLAEVIQYIERNGLEHFVIKPVGSASAVGCRCIVKEGDSYRDLQKSRRYQLEDLRQELRVEYASLGRPDEWMLEELLLPAGGSLTHIEDYKMFCFAGKVELIMHKRLKPGETVQRVRWYTRGWTRVEPIAAGKWTERADSTMAAPASAARLVEVAESAASRLCYPFMRVDLYDTTRGIVFGEFTPGPGAGRRGLNTEWEERLAKRWLEAAKTLEDGLRSGKIKPLMPEATT